MPAGSIVAFYNGVRMRSNALDTDEENYEGNAYKVTYLTKGSGQIRPTN